MHCSMMSRKVVLKRDQLKKFLNVGGIKHLFKFHITQQIVSSFKVSMVIPPDTATMWWNRGCRMVFQVNQKSKMISIGKLGNDRTCGKAVEIRYKNQINT